MQYKVWLKPAGEMSYLYGNNVLKAHVGRISENTPKCAPAHRAPSASCVSQPCAGIRALSSIPWPMSLWVR
jgi:hypothetical protein